jgi:hypothetical protein
VALRSKSLSMYLMLRFTLFYKSGYDDEVICEYELAAAQTYAVCLALTKVVL